MTTIACLPLMYATRLRHVYGGSIIRASARRIRDGLSTNGTPANALLGLTDAINALRDDIAARLPATEPAS